jgi:hypothetical protein
VYPESNWKWRAKPGYWIQKQNQRAYFEAVEEVLNIQSIEDWYNVSTRQILALGGEALLYLRRSFRFYWRFCYNFVADDLRSPATESPKIIQKTVVAYLRSANYKGSLSKALAAAFPEKDWKMWKFTKVPRGYWGDINNRQSFLADFAKEKHITQANDWNCIYT